MSSNTHTLKLVNECKQAEQDFEFYPTTNEILERLSEHINKINCYKDFINSVLDIGAGDGRVLEYLAEHINQGDYHKPNEFYALEKSRTLINELVKKQQIMMIGTDLYETTLIDKRADLVFCNPPYSQFSVFATKILSEANATHIALVIPQRWRDDENINTLIKERGLQLEVLGSFDFLEADRQARAKVELLFFTNKQNQDEQFSKWLVDTFKLDNLNGDYSTYQAEDEEQERIKNLGYEIAKGELIDALVDDYNLTMDRITKSIQSLAQVDSMLLKELNVDKDKLLKVIEHKLKNTKFIYWRELFKKLDKIRDRFTCRYSEFLSSSVVAENHIDFTKNNIYMILVWILENANDYIIKGMQDLFDSFSQKGNAMEYKSNQRWRKDEWRYTKEQFDNEARKLDYRIVLSGKFEWEGLLQDIRAVAIQLGYSIPYTFLPQVRKPLFYDTKDAFGFYGNTHTIYYKDNKTEILCELKPYKNGNIHIKFNKEFFAKFNIAVGKSRGWINNKEETKAEFKGVGDELIDEAFKASIGLPMVDGTLGLLEFLG